MLENLEKSKGTEWPPVVEPVIYYAQGRDAVYVKIKLAEKMDDPGCSLAFSRQMEIGPSSISLSVVCFENETNVKKYETKITFANEIDYVKIVQKEEGDGQIEFRVPKLEGQIYWSEILKNPNAANVVVWKSIQDYYFEEVNDLRLKE